MWCVLYVLTAKLLSQSTYCPPTRALRGFFAWRICARMRWGVNVERGATFGPLCSIGDRSGIGMRCELYGEVSIGGDLMMAPERCFYTRNHCVDRTDVPMGQQGESESCLIRI